MDFKLGEVKTFCKTPGCGVVQRRGPEGYWAEGWFRVAFTPIFAKPNHYQRYMAWRNQISVRKAGRRC